LKLPRIHKVEPANPTPGGLISSTVYSVISYVEATTSAIKAEETLSITEPTLRAFEKPHFFHNSLDTLELAEQTEATMRLDVKVCGLDSQLGASNRRTYSAIIVLALVSEP